MSLNFAMLSRRHAGNHVFRRGVALMAAFLAWQAARGQQLAETHLPAANFPASGTNAATLPADTNLLTMVSNTNSLLPQAPGSAGLIGQFQARLEEARHMRLMRQPAVAEPMLEALLADGTPETIQQAALLELAAAAQDENDLVRAQQIDAQFISKWSNDRRIPEIYLQQGQLFRQMGVNSLALAKFYSVMTAALALKSDQLDYYQRLVLEAQMEIAETHYQAGHFAEAADFFSRLLKQDNPALNRPEIQFRLIRSLQATANYSETAAQAHDFLARFPDSPNEPEVRFCLAQALKEMGQNNESLQQVLALLQEQKPQAREHPEIWSYWQQRTGNEIANQLFREGDYPKALDVYLNLEQLDHSPKWQLPVGYQIGLTYERLLQPQMAMQSYSNIVSREPELGTNASPGLKAILEMARWRIQFIHWQDHADSITQSLARPESAPPDSKQPASLANARQ
jgi:tetratricopeptide (TPR) repeat protein